MRKTSVDHGGVGILSHPCRKKIGVRGSVMESEDKASRGLYEVLHRGMRRMMFPPVLHSLRWIAVNR